MSIRGLRRCSRTTHQNHADGYTHDSLRAAPLTTAATPIHQGLPLPVWPHGPVPLTPFPHLGKQLLPPPCHSLDERNRRRPPVPRALHPFVMALVLG